jgi:hypothetical protein
MVVSEPHRRATSVAVWPVRAAASSTTLSRPRELCRTDPRSAWLDRRAWWSEIVGMGLPGAWLTLCLQGDSTAASAPRSRLAEQRQDDPDTLGSAVVAVLRCCTRTAGEPGLAPTGLPSESRIALSGRGDGRLGTRRSALVGPRRSRWSWQSRAGSHPVSRPGPSSTVAVLIARKADSLGSRLRSPVVAVSHAEDDAANGCGGQ